MEIHNHFHSALINSQLTLRMLSRLKKLEARMSAAGSSDVPRAVPKPVAYDRKRAREQPKDDADKFPYNNWSWFEKDSFEVSWDLVGKSIIDPTHRTPFVYIGRQTRNGNASVVKGSLYEWDFIHIHLRKLLDEIHCHPKPGAAFGDLVPMLANREGATETLTKENKMTFFDNAQVKQPSVLAKFVFSPIQGQYVLYVRTPVNDDVKARLKWPGPTHSFMQNDLAKLDGFLSMTKDSYN